MGDSIYIGNKFYFRYTTSKTSQCGSSGSTQYPRGPMFKRLELIHFPCMQQPLKVVAWEGVKVLVSNIMPVSSLGCFCHKPKSLGCYSRCKLIASGSAEKAELGGIEEENARPAAYQASTHTEDGRR